MKKFGKCFKYLIFALCVFCCGAFTKAFADGTSETKPQTSSLNKGRIVSSKYLDVDNITMNPEVEVPSETGDKLYKRNVVAKKDLKKIDKDSEWNSLASISLDVTFTYDKKSFVKIQNSGDLKSDKNNTKAWKVRTTTEVFPGKDVCLVSDRYAVYKNSSLGVGDYIMDGHIDLLCSNRGEIGVNTELC